MPLPPRHQIPTQNLYARFKAGARPHETAKDITPLHGSKLFAPSTPSEGLGVLLMDIPHRPKRRDLLFS